VPTQPTIGFDLAALNIQRGRELGIKSYNDLREAFGLARKATFEDISTDAETVARLKAVYASVDEIEAFVGSLAEDPVPKGSMGELLSASLCEAMVLARDGDDFWFESFTEDELFTIVRTKFSDIIAMNEPKAHAPALPSNVFLTKSIEDIFPEYPMYPEVEEEEGDSYKHGSIMIVAWLFLSPVGTFVARHLKQQLGGAWWFNLHRAAQVLAVLFTIVAASLMLAVHVEIDNPHAKLGMSAFVLCLCQLMLGLFRNEISGYSKRDPTNPADKGPRYAWCDVW
jgi:hypothetical protein